MFIISELCRYKNFLESLCIERKLIDFKDKKDNAVFHVNNFLSKTQSMFLWENLPDTIPARILELYLQTNGNVCFYKVDGELYVFTGGLGGYQDVYYRPTLYTIANPALNISATPEIDKDCVLMLNDSLSRGLLPIIHHFATLLAENELSLYRAMINSRLISVISASDDKTQKSAEKYVKDIENGVAAIIGENPFLDGIKVQPFATASHSNTIISLIELEQYLKASALNELGLNANFNMKRESINANESDLNTDSLLPLIDDMLQCRRTAANKVNVMFNTNINVRLSSSWEIINKESAQISGRAEISVEGEENA